MMKPLISPVYLVRLVDILRTFFVKPPEAAKMHSAAKADGTAEGVVQMETELLWRQSC